jgi:hypothetical protein
MLGRGALPLLLLALCSGCATARLVGDPAFTPEDPGAARNVVIEPLFEMAELQTTTRTEYARLATNPYTMSGMGSGGFGSGSGFNSMNNTVAVTRQVQEKPFFAKPTTLAEVQTRVMAEVQRRRPSWRVTSTAAAPVLKGEVTIVRTIIDGNELIASNRTLKNLAFGFGLLIWPLEFFNIEPVEETMRVFGLVERFRIDSVGLPMRLVKYPSQPDYAVNLAGVQSVRHEFGLDVTYTEGILADEHPRSTILVDGFVDRLAAAIVATVEEAP